MIPQSIPPMKDHLYSLTSSDHIRAWNFTMHILMTMIDPSNLISMPKITIISLLSKK